MFCKRLNGKYLATTFLFFMMSVVWLHSVVYALPDPIAVMGFVFYEDGSPADKGLPFSATNYDYYDYITYPIGWDTYDNYFITNINGYIGDFIVIRACNLTHYGFREHWAIDILRCYP